MTQGERQAVVGEMRLHVYLRPLHPEFFRILARRGFRNGSIQGDVWLIEAGHVITYLDGPIALTEVVAPRETELPQRGLAKSVDLAGSREHRLETRGPILYQMACQADTESPGTYLREAEDLLASARQGHLYFESPREACRRPFSYAVPESRGNGLLVHVWHGFPAENTILKTQTLIERVDP